MVVTGEPAAEPPLCFSWEVHDVPREPGSIGTCGVSGSSDNALRELSEALLETRPGTIGEVWRARLSQTRPAAFDYETLVARGVHDGRSVSITWQ